MYYVPIHIVSVASIEPFIGRGLNKVLTQFLHVIVLNYLL